MLGALEFARAAELVLSWRSPLIVSHRNPDGDALGSLIAMRSILDRAGAAPLALLFEPLPATYSLFNRLGPLVVLDTEDAATQLAGVDGAIVLDTCTYVQLEPIADWLRKRNVPILAVDHHVNRDDLADQTLVDESAAATCLILYEWFRSADLPLEHAARTALFIGIATDTGWFRHSNTDARALQASADLAREGVNVHQLYQELFQRDGLARVHLLARALSSLELHADGRLAVQTLTPQDYRAAGATPADTENIVNEPLRIASVAVSVILVQQEKGPIRVSLRSKPPLEPGAADVDVSAVAASLGGGGHRRAAAARVDGPLNEVKATVLDRISGLLKKHC